MGNVVGNISLTSIIIYIFLCVLLPVGLLCLFLERKARRIMLSFICGALACFGSYFLNRFLMSITSVSDIYFSMTFAPIVEEITKFIPIVIISSILKKGRRTSAALGFAVGIGFCVVENFYYIVKYLEFANLGWIIIRCVGTGLMHGMSATVIALGIYFGRQEKRMTPLCIMTSLFFAFMYHGMFNMMVSTASLNWIGIVIPIITYITIYIVLNKDAISKSIERNFMIQETPKEASEPDKLPENASEPDEIFEEVKKD